MKEVYSTPVAKQLSLIRPTGVQVVEMTPGREWESPCCGHLLQMWDMATIKAIESKGFKFPPGACPNSECYGMADGYTVGIALIDIHKK